MVDGSIRIDTKIDQTGVNKGLADIEKSCSSFVGVASGILAGVGLFEFGKAALKSTADIELAQAKLTTLLGNAEHAQSMINDIVKMADTTPYNSNDLIQAATTLKTFGVTADQIMPTLTALGNAAGGQAQNLQGVAYALGQTAAQGKMMTQDLYQFINAGVPLLDLLAKRLNKSKAEIKGMIEAGKIGYKEVNGALQEFYTGNGKYANLMAEAAKTLPGMWSTFQDSVTSFGRALVSVFEGPIKTALGVFTSMFTTLARVFNEMSAPAKNVLASFGSSVAIFVALTAAVGIATTAFSTLFTVLRSNPFMLIIGLIGTMIIKLMDLGDAAQDNMGLQPAEAERAVKTYERLIKTQDEVLKSAERAGDPKAAIAGYKRVEDALQYNIDKLKDLTPASAEWLQTVSQAAAQSKFLQTSKTLGFVTQEDILKADELAAKFEFLYKAKRKAAAGDTGGAGGDTGATVSAVSNRRKLWEDYFAWQTEQEQGSMEADLYILHTKYAAELDAMEDGDELKEALMEKQAGEEQAIRDKWAQRHKIAAFLYGFGVTEKTAEGMESGLFTVVGAVKGIGEAIADTFETIAEIFDFGASVLDWVTDFDYSDTSTRVLKYVNAIGNFFQSELGSMSILFDVGATAVENLLAGMMSNLPATVASIGNLLQHVAAYLTTNAPALIAQILAIVSALVSTIAENLPTLAGALARGFLQLLVGVIKMLPTITRGLIDAFIAVFGEIVQAAPALIDGLMQAITFAFSYLMQNAGTIAGQLVTLALKAVEGLVRNLPMIIQALVQAIPALMSMLFNDVPQAIIAELPTLIEELIPALVALIPILAAELPATIAASAGQALIAAAVLMPAEFLKASPAILKALVVSIASIPGQLYKEFSRMAGYAWKGFVEGLKKAGDIWSAVKKVFTGFVDAVKNFFGIHSPSTVFFDMGLDIIQGLINGILSAGGRIGSSLVGVLKSAMSAIMSLVPSFVSVGACIGSAIVSGMSSALSGIGSAVSSAGGGISGVVNTAARATGGVVNTAAHTTNKAVKKVRKVAHFATGTAAAPGGWSVVGEKGPELMNLKSGSTILSASDSIRAVMASLIPRTGTAAGAASATFVGEISAADVVIDGNTVGKIAFRYIDRQVKAAYGA